MPYAQGTLTSPNASNDMRVILDGLLIAAGWTLVETLTPSGVFRNSVYKSAGTSNLCHYDVYLLMAWQTTGTEQVTSLIAGTAYDTGTHILSQLYGAPFGLSGLPNKIDADANGVASTSAINASTLLPTTAGIPLNYQQAGNSNTFTRVPGIQTLLPSSAFAYWASVTLDHVSLFTTVASGLHTDGIISTLALDAGFTADPSYLHTPLVCWDIQSMFSGNMGLKGVASSTALNYVASAQSFTQPFGPKLPNINGTYYQAVAWKPYVWMSDASGANPGGTWDGTTLAGGLLVGQAPDFYMVYGGAIGDTVTIDGATYVLGPLSSTTGLTVAVLVE